MKLVFWRSESLEISHRVTDRKIFAKGAIKADILPKMLRNQDYILWMMFLLKFNQQILFSLLLKNFLSHFLLLS